MKKQSANQRINESASDEAANPIRPIRPFRPIVLEEIEDAVNRMQEISEIGEQLHLHSEAQRLSLEQAEAHIAKIWGYSYFSRNLKAAAKLRKLSAAIQRKRELLNAQEFGAFQLDITRALQTIYETLP